MPSTYFKPLVIGGQVHKLDHLDTFKISVPSEKAQRDLCVHIRFTTHCFTEGYDSGKHLPEDMMPDEGNRPRVFCPIRYALSLQLPGMLHGLNTNTAKVRQTAAGRNWTHSAVIQGQGAAYHLFFEVRRTPRDKRHLQDLNLTVESAYSILTGDKQPDVLGQIKFQTLMTNVFLGKPVSTRR